MASTFKTFLNNDKTTTRTLLHEAIPVTGTIMSGTYGEGVFGVGTETNIKNYSHGMFQSVYDYPYLSSSANHILDVTIGYSTGSVLSSSTQDATQRKNKINIYNQMAQVLVGHDKNGKIQRFDSDGNLADGAGKMNEVVFINFARLLSKDEIKKGSFNLDLGVGGAWDGERTSAEGGTMYHTVRLNDSSGSNGYFVNSPTGEYGVLYASNLAGTPLKAVAPRTTTTAGLVYYQAGIAVLTSSLFVNGSELGLSASHDGTSGLQADKAGHLWPAAMTGSALSASCDNFRHRIKSLSFNNTTELNSTIYFCRLNNNEFNYSSNPTYLSSSQIVTKVVSTDLPVSYVTTIGLYSADNELLATAKLSEPLRKDPSNELTVRVRLDY
tara:strand:- start:21 stop:1166 length:1146 start_codon:yes stop_codon:yes gene_type:complete